jgi:hypothetical protein
MKLLILATTVVFATSVHAGQPECTEISQPCSEIEMLMQINGILDKGCFNIVGNTRYSDPICKAMYMSDQILMKRGYIRTNDPGVWIKKPKGYVPSKAE